jgi:hypothetical protein
LIRELLEHWEVMAAAAVLILVLSVIDVVSLGAPILVLSLVPFLFLVLAALVRLTPQRVLLGVIALALVALATGDRSYLGLAYPAAVLGALLIAQGRAQTTP